MYSGSSIFASAKIGITGRAVTTVYRNRPPVKAALLLFVFSAISLHYANAEDLNIRNYGAVGDGHTDDGPAIQQTINAAIASHRPSHIIIPSGRYVLGPDFARGNAQLVIAQAHDLSVSGMPGAWLISAAPQRSIFAIDHSSNISIGGLTLDRAPALFGQGTIKSIDLVRRTATISTESTGDALDSSLLATSKLLLVFSDPKSGSWGDHSAACAFYKPSDPSVCWPPTIIARSKVGPNLWELKLNTPPQTDDLGKPAAIWSGIYKGRAFLITYSRDVTVHDLSYFAEGDEGGFIISHSAGTIKFNQFTAGIRPGSGRLLGSVGGAMVFNNHIKLILDHVDISQSWDDCLNMGANFARIYAQSAPTILQVDGSRADFLVGDHLAVWDWPRKAVVAKAQIMGISCQKGAKPTCQLTLDHPATIAHPGYAPTRSEGNDVDGIDRVIDLDGVGSLSVTNSSFQSLHARCLLIKASLSVVERSVCHDTVMAGIIIGPSFFWDEGPEAHDITIQNNVFRNVSGPNILVQNGGSSAAPANENITINNNRFVDYGRFQHGVNVQSGVPIILEKSTKVDLSGNSNSSQFAGSVGPASKSVDDNIQIK